MKLTLLDTLAKTSLYLALSCGIALAGTDLADTKSMAAALATDDAPIVTGSIKLEFSNYHLTHRGVDLQNQGLVTQQQLILNWHLYTAKDPKADFNSLTFNTGIWNDIDSTESGVKPNSWNECDPIIGFSARFLRDWTFDSNVWAFESMSNEYSTCWNWNPTVTYHDHFLPSFGFNPFVGFFDEFSNKTTVIFNKNTSVGGYYFEPGFDPTYKFTTIPLTLELPTSILLPNKFFYQRADGSPGGTSYGMVSTMIKATVPLKFVPASLGNWSVYTGVEYHHVNNPGALDGNQVVGINANRQQNFVQYHAGVTILF
jgi:hypothetical protein